MDEERKDECREKKDDYEFLKETIKAKPIDKKKFISQIGKLAGAGAVFGLAAALVFSLIAPGLLKRRYEKEQASRVTFSQEKILEERENTTGNEEEAEDPETGEAAEEPVQTIVQEMTPEDYGKLYQDMFATAEKAKKSMVTVIGSQNDEDWFQTPYESQISGLLVAESGQDYFILTEYRIVENVDRIQVVFCDGTMTDGRFLKEDTNTGFVILKVPKTGVPAKTKEEIEIAPLGESYYVKQGEPVLAIGSPMGYSDSVGYGIVTSVSNTVSRIDAEYGLLNTDIPGSTLGSGILLNLDGEIVGIIAQSFAGEDIQNLVTGLQVSQMKEMIQILSDETREMVYMGITGGTITSDISEKKGIPVGVFVEQVEVESPAMQVGIQNGDVIIELNGERIETVKGYQQQLKACKAGSTVKVKAMRQGTEGYVEVSFDVMLKTR